jgi:hypothetical protein
MNVEKMDLLEMLCFDASLKVRAATMSHFYEVAFDGLPKYREKAEKNNEEAMAALQILREALN